jgi:hypothetical protein
VRAWYADRALPFPTLLETRDDASFVERDTARTITDNAINELYAVAHSDPARYFSARQVGIDPDAHKEAIEKMSVFLRG